MSSPSLYKSFDTSLIDVNRSFSSTEYATSEGSRPDGDNAAGRAIEKLETSDLYEKWAATYDTDGNFLQSVDDIQTKDFLPRICELAILDLGCGTGRTTLKLLQHPWNRLDVSIEGWDASPAMLEVNLLDPADIPSGKAGTFDLILSTLALEHFPLFSFFGLISIFLKPGGIAFVSNIHPDMGVKSVAGFHDAGGVRKIGTSCVHYVGEMGAAAREAGQMVEEVKEVRMEERWIEEGVVGKKGRKWIGTKVWVGILVRRI
ncbi:hypothetical protein DOTSEDRAFT_85353 [Dothistroma septosporum NZE10]|uniref:Methyltransferase domain-containing protein n=1 Tax=Dothistroma septosporum (strain NZE10 / CBS 128990) TaxID=675120 RepID=N1Q4B7_DOTSN|nr:hypothetical protein DOTSEDRAFT_85353 [Dothistroma septosporum NZE10]